MQTPVVSERPSKRIQRRRRVAMVQRAQPCAMHIAYRRRSATGTTRVATAFTRWVGR